VASVVFSLLHSLRFTVRSRAWLHLEIIALRHQLAVLNRSRRPRLRLTSVDRMLWAWLAHAWCGSHSACTSTEVATITATIFGVSGPGQILTLAPMNVKSVTLSAKSVVVGTAVAEPSLSNVPRSGQHRGDAFIDRAAGGFSASHGDGALRRTECGVHR
jgi:hypothetical protein